MHLFTAYVFNIIIYVIGLIRSGRRQDLEARLEELSQEIEWLDWVEDYSWAIYFWALYFILSSAIKHEQEPYYDRILTI